jgi:hypothetical protein
MGRSLDPTKHRLEPGLISTPLFFIQGEIEQKRFRFCWPISAYGSQSLFERNQMDVMPGVALA